MYGSVPFNPHLKWHIGNSLGLSVFVMRIRQEIRLKVRYWRKTSQSSIQQRTWWSIGLFSSNSHFQCLKLAGHNSMEWQEQRLAVERLPCSEIEQFSLGKIWKENRVIQSSISSRTALCHKPSPEMGHSRWDIRGNWTLLLFFQWMVQFPIILTSNGTYECW